MARRTALPDHLIYAVCERFIKLEDPSGEKWSTDNLAKWLTKQGHPTTREAIFPIIRQSIARGHLRFNPPRETVLSGELAASFPGMPADTRVIDTTPETSIDNLATATADLMVELIRKVDEANKRASDASRAVHIGLGGGGTTQIVSRCLAERLRTEGELPPLVFHALSSGFDINRPLSAPSAFFTYFAGINHKIDFVGLFSAAVVQCSEYDKIKKFPGINESFTEAGKIDIVVTSFAQADDAHGLLNIFLEMHGGNRRRLADGGHVGDVLWQPYSPDGPLTVDTGVRAVTLFDLPGLVHLAGTSGKHVILLAGPCIVCRSTKAAALRPLLEESNLRVCNHLVTDVTTARDLLR